MRNRLSGFLAVLLVTAVFMGIVPAIKAQPPLPAMWIEPAILNFNTTSTHVGDKFNATVLIGTTGDTFTYQFEVDYNSTQLNCTSAVFSTGAASQFFAGHTVVPTLSLTTGIISGGETLLGADVVHATSRALIINMTFQILISPPTGGSVSSLISLNPANTFVLDPDLNTITGVSLGNAAYTFSAGAPPPTRHDVAITSVTPSTTHPVQNDTISIAVVALNNGTVAETFDVNVTYDGTLIGTQTVTALAAGSAQTLTFNWNTTGVALGPYTLTAKAAAVPGDADLSNNVKTATVTVQSSVGPNYDLNGDGIVDMKDIGIAAKAFGTSAGDPRWNPLADVNGDGKVDLRDIALIARHFG